MPSSVILHFDSLYANYSTSQQYNTFKFDNAQASSSAISSYNAEFTLPYPIKNVKQLRLKSCELPIALNSVRANSQSNSFSYSSDNATWKTIYLTDANYTDIAVLIIDLNAKMTATYPADGMVFSLVNNKVKLTSSAIANVYVKDTTLAFMLGYDANTNLLTTNNNSAALSYLLSMDLYLTMWFPNVSTICNNANGKNSGFKVPLNAVSGSIYYLAEGTSYIQTINTDIAVLERLSVCMLDRFGYSLTSNGFDYSFSLEIVY